MATERAPQSTSEEVFDGRVAGLDAMRALAVVLVVIYHLFPAVLPGGFLGVDIFFVVSGFLITGLLLAESRRSGRIRLGAFWQRRFRRLVPGLIVMVLVCTAAAATLGGDILVGIRRQLAGTLTFTNNWLSIASGASYARDFTPELYTHTWSLAVEEQFYLLWPPVVVLVLAVCAARRRSASRALAVTTATLAAASAVAMGVLVKHAVDPTRVYYGTDTHLFGLMAGAGLAIAISSVPGRDVLNRARRSSRARNTAGLLLATSAAVLCLLAAAMHWESVSTYRGGLALVSATTVVAISALLVLPESSREAERGALSWVGVRSYGLYLYHWPLLVIVKSALPDSAGSWQGGIVIILTVLLAALSYRFVEQPVRRQGIRASLRRSVRVLRPSLTVYTPQAMRLRRRTIALATVVVLAGAGAAVGVARAPQHTQLEQQLAAGLAAANATDSDDNAAGPATVPATLPAAAPATPSASGTPGHSGQTSNPTTQPSAPALVAPKPTGGNTTVIGDSVTLAGAVDLKSTMPGIVIRAEVGRQMFEAPALAQQLRKQQRLRPYVVISLVTNSTVNDAMMADVMDAVGPHHAVILVTGHGDRSWIGSSNKALRRAAKKYSQVILADWDAAADQHPGIFGPDGIHPQVGKTALYTKVIQQALQVAATKVFEQ